MSAAHFEAKLYALRKSKDGVVVSFVCHPSDVKSDLMGLDIGSRLMVGWCQIGDDERPKDNRAAKGKDSAESPAEAPRETKPRRAFKDLSYPEQAGIRCEDATFQAFIRARGNSLPPSEYVRQYCGIASRAELSTNHDALKKWRKLDAEYQGHLTDEKYAAARR